MRTICSVSLSIDTPERSRRFYFCFPCSKPSALVKRRGFAFLTWAVIKRRVLRAQELPFGFSVIRFFGRQQIVQWVRLFISGRAFPNKTNSICFRNMAWFIFSYPSIQIHLAPNAATPQEHKRWNNNCAPKWSIFHFVFVNRLTRNKWNIHYSGRFSVRL